MLRLPMLAVTGIVVFTAGAHWWMDGFSSHAPEVAAKVAHVETPKPVAAATEDGDGDGSEVQDKIKHRNEFAAYADGVVTQVCEGRLSLHQARDRVLYYCLAHYPDYLNHVQIIEQGRSLKVKLARCLLRFVHDHDVNAPGEELDPKFLSNLDSEFNAMEHEEDGETASTNNN